MIHAETVAQEEAKEPPSDPKIPPLNKHVTRSQYSRKPIQPIVVKKFEYVNEDDDDEAAKPAAGQQISEYSQLYEAKSAKIPRKRMF